MTRTLILTTPNEKGPDVKAAQTHLTTNPYGKFYAGPIDGEYGVLTSQAAYRAKYHIGYSLGSCDHAYGDLLNSYLTGAKPLTALMKLRRAKRSQVPAQTIGDKAFAEATKWVGTKESPPGSNMNPFGAWYGANGVAWCAEFVSYCHNKAGSSFKYAFVPYIVNDARAGRNGLVALHASEVKHGDVVCFDWPGESPGVADHVGLFDKWINATTFTTIEGNTSSDAAGDQSNGGEVCRKERYTNCVAQFVRVTK